MNSTENLTVVTNFAADLHDIIGQRKAPGILLFTEGMQLFHANTQGAEFCQELNRRNGITGSAIEVPVEIGAVGNEVRSIFQRNDPERNRAQYDVSRIVSHIERPMLLRGFGIPDFEDPERSVILVLIERIGEDHRPSIENAKRKFRLTVREECVVCQLAKGQTNKEIARTLSIAEETVKQHIKNIMVKTRSTTRTGILARVIHE